MSLLTPILQGDVHGLKMAKLQRWLRLAVDNAGISYSMSGLLTDINQGDVEGLKWAKLGAWMKLLAENIAGAGGGGTAINNYVAVANNAGNTTITPDKSNYKVGLTIGGAARTSVIILDTTGRTAGDVIGVIATLPATVGIVLEFRDATAGGTLLLPAEIYASQQYDTDGVDLSATFNFVYTGTAWKYDLSKIPA